MSNQELLPLEEEICSARRVLGLLLYGQLKTRKRRAKFHHELCQRRCKKRLIEFLNCMNKYTNSTILFGSDSDITNLDRQEYAETRIQLENATRREEELSEYITILDQMKFVEDLEQCGECDSLIIKSKSREMPCHIETVCKDCYNEMMKENGNLCRDCIVPYLLETKEFEAIS